MRYHAGELEVQSKVGRFDDAVRVAAAIRPFVPPRLARFLATQPWILLGALDSRGRVSASVRTGPPGFIAAEDPVTVHISGRPAPDDPLGDLRPLDRIALLAIDPARRFRARINGTVAARPAGSGPGLTVTVGQAYPNCMKYIQRREQLEPDEANAPPPRPASTDDRLSEKDATLVEGVDTFFLASIAPEGADVSHRGGPPGFLEVIDPATLRFPDYSGNSMFNTLGNIDVDPRIGLLIPDLVTGNLLHVSGRAVVEFDPPVTARHPGAERLITVRIEHLLRRPSALPLRFGPPEPSPFLPPPA